MLRTLNTWHSKQFQMLLYCKLVCCIPAILKGIIGKLGPCPSLYKVSYCFALKGMFFNFA